jgi:peroxiredoxin
LLGLAFATSAHAAVRAGQRAEDFELRDLGGKAVRLSQLRGKVVLLDFWASWCEPCKKELPLLSELAGKLREHGIEVVTVNIDKSRDNAESFVRAHGLGLTVLLNPDQSVAEKYEPPKMPTSFIIDKKGLCRHVNAGFEPGDEKKLEKQLLDLAGK